MLVGDWALGGGRDVEPTFGHLFKASPESLNHIGVAPATVVLDVKVKSIHDSIAKRTRAASGFPCVGLWTKRSPEPVGEFGGGINSFNLICFISTTKGQEDLLASCLTGGNILHQVRALRVQLRWDTIDKIGISPALVTKVAAGQAGQWILIWEGIDESNVDYVESRVLAKLGKTRLGEALAIVDGDIGLGLRNKSRRKRG